MTMINVKENRLENVELVSNEIDFADKSLVNGRYAL